MNFKQFIKNILYKFPSKYVFMFHHVCLNPQKKSSRCLLDTKIFKDTCIKYKDKINSIDNFKNNKIVITFDDGLEDLYTIAYPFLKENNIPFLAFIVTGLLDTPGYITTSQLKEISKDPLVTIGSHGVTHEVLVKMSASQKEKEINESKKLWNQ